MAKNPSTTNQPVSKSNGKAAHPIHEKIGSDVTYAAHLIKEGKLVAIPTETVYGLAADAKNPNAIAKVFEVKGRPPSNPLIIHLSSYIAISDWAIDIPKEAFQLAECFWPGPLTLVLNRHPEVPKIVTANQETVALRVPNHKITLELLREFKGGLAAPSANRSGRISPTQSSHVQEDLGDAVEYILEGGRCELGIESTILYLPQNVSDKNPARILRHGSIDAQEIASALGKNIFGRDESNNVNFNVNANVMVSSPHTKETIRTPGSDLSHYAPHHPLYLLSREDLYKQLKNKQDKKEHKLNNAHENNINNKKIAILCFQENDENFQNVMKALSPQVALCLQIDRDPKQYARDLYSNLRKLDAATETYILVEKPPLHETWLAVLDRLQRAATK